MSKGRRLKKIFEIVYEHTLKVLGKKGDYCVSLSLVSKEEIHVLNKQYRDVDRPTDVLTFAFLEGDDAIDLPVCDLGSIIISPEVALEQAKSFSHPEERELAFLFIHGLLHAFGYDHHRSEEEATIMFALQNKILNSLPYHFFASENKVKKLLLDAQKKARAPYSKFRVGAVLTTKDGKLHQGFNIENSAYGSCMCGERVALYHTYASGYQKEDIACLDLITDSENVGTPCGECRQVMSELMDRDCPVFIYNKDMSKCRVMTVEELLPAAFSSEDLGL